MNGKGKGPEKGRNLTKYRQEYERIFRPKPANPDRGGVRHRVVSSKSDRRGYSQVTYETNENCC
jgi:hypothetical protein